MAGWLEHVGHSDRAPEGSREFAHPVHVDPDECRSLIEKRLFVILQTLNGSSQQDPFNVCFSDVWVSLHFML